MVDVENALKIAGAVGTPVLAIVQVLGKKRRLRNEIRENLDLVQKVYENPAAVDLRSPAGWLQGQIAVDIARLAGQKVGTIKKPIEWGSVALAAVLFLAFGGWSYYISRDGFEWWAVVPGFASFLFGVSILGMVTDRKIPPEQSNLPDGAVPIRTDTAAEQVAGAIAMGASGEMDDRWDPGMPIDVVMQFLKHARVGNVKEVRALCDSNFNHCRLLTWLHTFEGMLKDAGIQDPSSLDLESLPEEAIDPFFETEAGHLRAAFGDVDPADWAAASKRRILGPNHELVIVTPTPTSGGFWVHTATALPNAMTFVLSSTEGEWRIAAANAPAPPLPTWPPSYWNPMFESDFADDQEHSPATDPEDTDEADS